jgi:hypothetical protein
MMMRQTFAALLAALPLPALAESWVCQTQGYCTNQLECSPDTARLVVDFAKDGRATFGWEHDTVRFSAAPEPMNGMTIYRTANNGDSALMLAWTGGADATFSLTANLAELGIYSSFHALTCTRT